MDENKIIDLILLTIFIAGATFIGLFFLNNLYKQEDITSLAIIEKETPKPPQSYEPQQDDPVSMVPKSLEVPQEKLTPQISESSVTDLRETIEEPSPVDETALVAQADSIIDSNEAHVGTVKEDMEDIADTKEEILLEAPGKNGTIQTAQFIKEGKLEGSKENADDTADLYKIRSTGQQMILYLEPGLTAIKNRSVITIYDSKLKAIGEYFASAKTEMILPVALGSLYYIRMNLTSVGDPSFPYKLMIKFQDSSSNEP